MSESTYLPLHADEYLQQWGFSQDPPPALREHAEHCERYGGQPLVEVLTGLGLATREAVQGALANRPSNVLPLEHVAQSIPALREHALRVTAVTRRLPFFAVLEPQWSSDAPELSEAAQSRLEELNAAHLRTPGGRDVLAFSELAGLLSFSQCGPLERERDPLHQAVTSQTVLALAAPALVAKAGHRGAGQEAMRVVTSSAQDNHWSPGQAKTEAERTLARILDEALSRRATDVEIAPQRDGTARLRLRIYGDMTGLERHSVLSPETAREVVNFLVSRSRAGDGGRLRKAADGQMTYKNAQTECFIRASFIPADRFGLDFDMISASLRLLPRTAKSISLRELNLQPVVNDEVRRALMRTQGLIVLAGPTNSGKSTTIAGVVGEHIQMFGGTKKRLSLEDPVERYLDGITQISVEGNFAELVRALLRHDPDLVWVGEIRDSFSAGACVRAATSGHVVLSTVHANNSILAFRAISNYLRKDTGEATGGGGASLFDLAESVSLLIGQRLVKRLCPHCRQPHRVTKDERELLRGYLQSEGQAELWPRVEEVFRQPIHKALEGGCDHCNGQGYVGEMPVNEVLPITREVRDIFSRSDSSLDFAALSGHRLNTLAQSALTLVERGDTEFASLFI